MESMDETIIRDEEALLACAHEAIERARRARTIGGDEGGLRDAGELRTLRDEANETAEDDLPSLLHEMSVRHRLRERASASPLPDPASPYVAHLRIDEAGTTRDYLLGQASFFDVRAGVRIVDWRTAPIAQVFYRYREGDEIEEEIAGRMRTGVVVSRRIVVIEDGRLTRILGSGVALAWNAAHGWARDAGPELAAGGSGIAARGGTLGVGVGASGRAASPDVTALLDAEQHAAIAAPADRGLLVIGSAGSGKTTVALHRLARLHARDPKRFPLERTRVVVPEEGLARLSRRLLSPLGVREAQVATLDHWAIDLARRTFGGVPRIGDETPAIVVRLKRHPALYDALRARLAKLAPQRAKTIPRLRHVLGHLLSDRVFLGSIVDASRGDLPRYVIEETVRHTMRQLDDAAERQLADITDPSAKRAIDGRSVSADTPEATGGSIDVEDLPIFLCVRAWRAGLDAARIAHLVIDEAEDFSLFELHVLGALLDTPRSATLAGDDAQRTGTGFAGWPRALDVLGVRGASECRLSVSYRCPRPIVALAQRILGNEAPEAPANAFRDGAPIARDTFQGEAHAHLVLADALRDLVDREPRAAIAVIAESADTAQRVYESLADLPRTRLVLDGAFDFVPGIDVTHVDAVKGLEFDYVVVPDLTAQAYPDEPEARRRLHVAVTRAAYQLWLITPGAPSPIVEGS